MANAPNCPFALVGPPNTGVRLLAVTLSYCARRSREPADRSAMAGGAEPARNAPRPYTADMSTSCGDEYLEPYREAFKRFGPKFESMLWGSPETQRIRFDVMIELAGFEQCVILDIGCGLGDFAVHLVERAVSFERYLGIDGLEAMIAAAQRRHLPRCEFIAGDVLADPDLLDTGPPDWICISGTLNTMDEAVARRLVESSFQSAAQGVVFNFLSDRFHKRWVTQNLGPARRFNTTEWLDWSLAQTSRVDFTQSYLDGHDATIMLRHDGD